MAEGSPAVAAVVAPAEARTAAGIRRELAATRQRVTANVDAVEERLRHQVSRLVQAPDANHAEHSDALDSLVSVLSLARDVGFVRRWLGTPMAIAGLAAGFAVVTLRRSRRR